MTLMRKRPDLLREISSNFSSELEENHRADPYRNSEEAEKGSQGANMYSI